MLRALVPMVVGIVCGTLLALPFYVWTVAAFVCAVTVWAARERRIAVLYIALTIVLFGAALARAHFPQPIVPEGERVWLEVRITDNPTLRSRSAHTYGVVARWQPDNENMRPDADGEAAYDESWRRAGEKMLVGFDTMYRFSAGDRIVFRGYVNPVSDSTNSYSRLMRARGYTGRTYISRYSHPTVLPAKTGNLAAIAKKMQTHATERLGRLRLAPGELAVATAMTTGDRTGITPELRRTYSRTGASHLLAVSGLHVGIVFLMINVLLYLLPLARRGHIIKNILAVVAIWFYAALTGLSPSAVRAACMFTGAQAAFAMSATRSATNILCATAFVMLAVSPGMLFDISFQLSFIAVAAIMAWFGPLYRLVESRWRGLNALWATLIVGLTASLATMPLVSHTFGVFSPAGIVLNPVVILTAHLVVVFSLIWIIAPVPFMEPVFRWLVGGPAWLQNRVVGAVANVPGAAVEWSMPLWMVFAVYAAMIIFTAWLCVRPRREEPFVLPR